MVESTRASGRPGHGAPLVLGEEDPITTATGPAPLQNAKKEGSMEVWVMFAGATPDAWSLLGQKAAIGWEVMGRPSRVS